MVGKTSHAVSAIQVAEMNNIVTVYQQMMYARRQAQKLYDDLGELLINSNVNRAAIARRVGCKTDVLQSCAYKARKKYE